MSATSIFELSKSFHECEIMKDTEIGEMALSTNLRRVFSSLSSYLYSIGNVKAGFEHNYEVIPFTSEHSKIFSVSTPVLTFVPSAVLQGHFCLKPVRIFNHHTLNCCSRGMRAPFRLESVKSASRKFANSKLHP